MRIFLKERSTSGDRGARFTQTLLALTLTAWALGAGSFAAPLRSLDLARRSAELVRLQDKSGWLDLYAEGSTVEDPVGTLVHRKDAPRTNLDAFWETYIAPNQIVFESHFDCESSGMAIRDVTIHTVSSSGLSLSVPAFVVYRASATDPGRIESMRAFWEIRAQFQAAAKAGEEGRKTSSEMLRRIFRYEGFPGLFAFVEGFLTPLKARRARIFDLLGDAFPGVQADLEIGKVLISGTEALVRVRVQEKDFFAHVHFGAGSEVRGVQFLTCLQ
jgi:hypothetical protein